MRRGITAGLAVSLVGAVVVLATAHSGGNPPAPARLVTVPTTPVSRALTSFVPPNASKHPKLLFDADFRGTTLDTSVWSTCYRWAPPGAGCTNSGNGEWEWYMPSQVSVRGGLLRLAAQPKVVQGIGKHGKPETFYCASGMVTSLPGFNFEYGNVQIVARVPYGNNLWPALWLAASDGRWPPEIDMLEHWDNGPEFFSNFHPVGGSKQYDKRFRGGLSSPNLSVGWHLFGLWWTPNEIITYVDGKKLSTVTTGIPHQDMYLVANLAANLHADKVPCRGTMLIKSIKVYKY